VLLLVEPPEPVTLDSLQPEGVVVALDQVTDPHNVGAILRSAAAFGVKALIVTGRHSPEVTGVLAKAASGALEHVPICEVRNLAQALEDLGSRGFQRIGLDSDGAEAIGAVKLTAPLCLVLGAEGKGLRPVTQAACDTVVHLPMPGAIRSLNVSNAAAIALYAATTTLSAAGSR
jgi:23S rRNA (guanosine2251-2'-O)-methyltransferase